MSTTKLEWTGEVWNPTVGCTRVSPACDRCYAIGRAHRGMQPAHKGLTILRPKSASRPGVDWNGTVRLLPHRLDAIANWKWKRVFVNSMSDLFHAQVPDEYIDRVYDAMRANPYCTYQVLTKRPARALRWYMAKQDYWAMEGVQLGVSCGTQSDADEFVLPLLQTMARVRWASFEPLIERIVVRDEHMRMLDWIVIGGESGPGARHCDLAWIRSLRDQAHACGVPVFIKQLGSAVKLDDYKGGNMEEWPEDLRVREWPREEPGHLPRPRRGFVMPKRKAHVRLRYRAPGTDIELPRIFGA